MRKIEEIIELMKDDVLPAKRILSAHEVYKIKELASKHSEEGKEVDPSEAILDAIEIGYTFGFWMGWKYCEADNDIFPGKE